MSLDNKQESANEALAQAVHTDRGMKSPLKKTWEIIFGTLLILVGIAGLILPIMPGWALIIPGLIILGKHIPPIARLTIWGMEKVEPYIPLKYRRKVTRFRRAYRRAVSATMRA